MSDAMHWMSARELAAEIRAGDLSSREVLDHLVTRHADAVVLDRQGALLGVALEANLEHLGAIHHTFIG